MFLAQRAERLDVRRNRPVLAICAILTCLVRPCCAACRQNAAKSGGIGKVLKISTPSCLNMAICEEIVGRAGPRRRRIDDREAPLASSGARWARMALPSASLG